MKDRWLFCLAFPRVPRLLIGKLQQSAQGVVVKQVGSCARCPQRLSRKGILSTLQFCRERQVVGAHQAAHNSEHGIQTAKRNSESQVFGLREGICSEQEYLSYGTNTGMEPVLLTKLLSFCKFREKTQTTAHLVQNLWKELHSSHGKSGHLFQTMRCTEPPYSEKAIPKEVFNIEVEGNHNYFADGVLVGNCDEAAFVPEEVITQVVTPMLSTTDGILIMISTPYDKNHYFFKAFNSPRWSRYQFKTQDNPLVKKEWLEEQREEIGDRQFRQEYLAEFVDDEKTYFPMALLRSAVHVCEDAQPCRYCAVVSKSSEPTGELYAG